MFSKLTQAEQKLNVLLPPKRLEESPSGQLLAASREWSATVWDVAEQLGAIPLSDEQLTDGKRLADNPVFIFGVHRSGTTLVKDILDGHPDLVVLPSEGTYYTNLEVKLQGLPKNQQAAFLGKEWLRRLSNPINQPPYWLLGRSGCDSSPYVDFARYLLAWWVVLQNDDGTQWPHMAVVLAYASCTGKLKAKLWVDKTPTNERFLKRIWREMPQAKIIHVIRDPADTLVSRKKMEPSVSMRRALTDLKISFDVALEQSALNDSRFFLVSYENLCEVPAIATALLATFLTIDFTDTLNQPSTAGLPTQANSSFKKDAPLGQILKPTQHPQQQKLSKADAQLLAAYMCDLCAKMGYPLLKINPLLKLYLRLRQRLW